MFFPYTCHLLPIPTSQGKDFGQEDLATPAGLMEGLMKRFEETEDSIVEKHQRSQET